MAISAEMVKKLRQQTGAGIMDCKKALAECDSDFEKAIDFLRKKGIATAAKRAGRETSQGTIQSYIHMTGKIGTMVEVNCETDFVAKNEEFMTFARDLAMHIAATDPVAIAQEDVQQDVIDREMAIYRDQAKQTGKPDNILDKIATGKMQKFFKENCLMNQPFVKDTDKTISDLLNEMVGKTGEKIIINRIARFQLGAS